MLLADGRNEVRMVEHQPVHRFQDSFGDLWLNFASLFLFKVREGHKIFIIPGMNSFIHSLKLT